MSLLRCRGIAPEDQRGQSLTRLLRFLREDVGRYSPYYRHKFAALGVDISAIADEAQFADTVPFTSKEELRAHFEDFVLRPNYPGRGSDTRVEEITPDHVARYRAAALRTAADSGDIEKPQDSETGVWREFLADWQPILTTRTGGTTGTAAQSCYTLSDIHGPLRRAGLFHHNFSTWTPEQRYMSLLPAGEHLGFYGNFLVPLLNGQPLRPMFGGRVTSTENQVLVAQRERTQALFGTSSYLVAWLETACKMMADGRIDGLPDIEMVSASAEALSEGYTASIRRSLDALGAKGAKILQGMSSTELKSGGFRECDEASGLHVDPQHFFIEVIDPETRRPVAPGEPGVLVWSHIDWHGTVILRYWSGDLIEGGTAWDECAGCGLTVPRLFGPFRRLENDFIKVRGARVDLAELRAAIETALARDTYQIEILAGDDGRYTVHAYVEDHPGLNAGALHEIVMTAVELRIDRLTLVDHADMQTRLYGGGGWKPRWLIHA